jgi:hypothetical protein
VTYEDTESALVSIRSAIAQCRSNGADARISDNGRALVIVDGHSVYSGDVWGKVRVYDDGRVSARAVLSVLGY